MWIHRKILTHSVLRAFESKRGLALVIPAYSAAVIKGSYDSRTEAIYSISELLEICSTEPLVDRCGFQLAGPLLRIFKEKFDEDTKEGLVLVVDSAVVLADFAVMKRGKYFVPFFDLCWDFPLLFVCAPCEFVLVVCHACRNSATALPVGGAMRSRSQGMCSSAPWNLLACTAGIPQGGWLRPRQQHLTIFPCQLHYFSAWWKSSVHCIFHRSAGKLDCCGLPWLHGGGPSTEG